MRTETRWLGQPPDRRRSGRKRHLVLTLGALVALGVGLGSQLMAQQGGAPSGSAEPNGPPGPDTPPCEGHTTGKEIKKEHDCDGRFPPPPPKEPGPPTLDQPPPTGGGPDGPTTGGGNTGGPTTGGGVRGPITPSGNRNAPTATTVNVPDSENPNDEPGVGPGSLFGPRPWHWTDDRSISVEDGSVRYWLDQATYPGPTAETTVRIGALYQSNMDYNGVGSVGSNWLHTFYKRVFPQPNGDVRVIDHEREVNDHTNLYTYDPINGVYLSPAAKTDTLTAVAGGGWKTTRLDGFATNFDSAGRVTSEVDSNGNSIDYVYDVNGDLMLVVDAVGRPYTVITSSGYIVQITDFEGNEYDYAQDANLDLAEAGFPENSFLAPGAASAAMVAGGGTSVSSTSNTVGGGGLIVGSRTWAPPPGTRLSISPSARKRLKAYLSGRTSNPTLAQVDLAARTRAWPRTSQSLAAATTATAATGGGTASASSSGGLSYLPSHHIPKTVGTAYNGTKTVRSFTYTSGTVTGPGASNVSLHHNLTTVVEPSGTVSMLNTYDSQDRVLTQTNALGGTWTVSYPGPNTVTVIDPNGNRTDYTLLNGSVSDVHQFTDSGQGFPPLRTGEPNWYHTEFKRNHPSGSGVITETIHPSGMREEFLYDAQMQLVELRRYNATQSAYLKSTWVWNGSGKMTEFIPERGHATGTPSSFAYINSYDSAGNLISTTHPTVTVNGSPQSTSYSFTYNSKGQIKTVTFPDGVVREFGYSPTGGDKDLMISITNDVGGPQEVTQLIAYDAMGNPISYSIAGQTFVEFAYDGLRRRIGVLEGTTWKESYIYDEDGNQLETIMDNELANGTLDVSLPTIHRLWTFDPAGNLVSESQDVDATTMSTLTVARDLLGNAVTITDASGVAEHTELDERDLPYKIHLGWNSGDVGVWEYAYDADGKISSMKDPVSRITTVALDEYYRPHLTTYPDMTQRELLWNEHLQPVQDSVLDSNGGLVWRRRMEYDEKDRLVTMHSDRVVSGSVVSTYTATIEHDASDRVTKVLDPDGPSEITEYDRLRRVSAHEDGRGNRVDYVYSVQGLPLTATHTEKLSGGATQVITREWVRDSTDKLVAFELRGSQTTRRWEYDINGRSHITKITDPLGNVRHFVYDGLAQLTSETQEIRVGGVGTGALIGTSQVSYTYDLEGKVTSITDAANNTRSFTYDGRGRLQYVQEADSTQAHYVYNAASEITGWTDAAGNVFSLTYDNASNPVTRSVTLASGFVGPTSETFAYDALGYVTSATRGNSTVTTARDSNGMLLSETQNGFSHSVAYDNMSRRSAHTRFDGSIDAYGWTAHSRLATISRGGVTRATFSTHGNGTYSGRTNVNGTTVTPAYSDLNEVSALTHFSPGPGNFWDTQYSYDGIGNVAAETWLHQGGAGHIWSYDSQYQIASAKEGVANVAAEIATPGSQAIQTSRNLSYDSGRNRTQESVTTGGATTVTNYTTDSRNFYTGIGALAPTRDANGNTTFDGTNSFVYDAFDQVTSVTGPSGMLASYEYDSARRRYKKTTSSGSTTYLYDELRCIEERDANGVVQVAYVYGERLDELIESVRLDTVDFNQNGVTNEYLTYTYHQDKQGNVVAITDSTGALVETYEYDSFGVPTIRNALGTVVVSSLIGNEIMMHGARLDPETGLYHMRNRYYNPTTGRFLSTDVLGQADDANMYQFVRNNPVNGTDPMGLSEFNFDITATLKNFTKDQFIQLVKELRFVLAELLELIPGLGEIINVVAFITGKHPVTGEEVSFGFWDKVELAADVISLVFIGGKIIMKALHILKKAATLGKLVEKVKAAIAKVAGIARKGACKVGLTDGCFVGGTLVHTADGLAPIESLDPANSSGPSAGQDPPARSSSIPAKDETGRSVLIWTDGDSEPAEWRGGAWIWIVGSGWVRVDDVRPNSVMLDADGSKYRILHVVAGLSDRSTSGDPELKHAVERR